MIVELKKRLLNNPSYIEQILTEYEFPHISVNLKEIRFARNNDSNPSSIRIKLINNDNLYVNDFARGNSHDLIKFIMKEKNLDFKTIITSIKKVIGIDNNFYFIKKKTIFGGFYEGIRARNNNVIEQKTYEESVLDEYKNVYSSKFFKDNIEFETQDYFDIRFDEETQRVVFPIRDWDGSIIGIKGRANWDVSENEAKYLYLIPCRISQILFGYSQNYSYLCDNSIIVFEAEKSTMVAHSYGYRNTISLGGNSISTQQCKMIMSLNPKEVIFTLDAGLDLEITKNNIEKLKLFTKMSDVKIKYWDWQNSKYIDAESKDSIIDRGKDIFTKILKEELLIVE